MINGNPTVADAAKELGVSSKTIRTYITKGIVGVPPTMEFGLRTISIFPSEYIEECKMKIMAYKDKLKKKNAKIDNKH